MLLSVGVAAPVAWSPSDPVASRPKIPAAKTTNSNAGVSAESCREFIIPASSEPDYIAEDVDAMIVPARK
ncbi:hypothetical protein [Nitrobacter sp. JJSN]|uniref:hypothetical protein n=1 Tax=Nitrobacter sp. JJSN TaxID=3453033 RepID=UPI003F772788